MSLKARLAYLEHLLLVDRDDDDQIVNFRGERRPLNVAAVLAATPQESRQLLDNFNKIVLDPPQPAAEARYMRILSKIKRRVLAECRATGARGRRSS